MKKSLAALIAAAMVACSAPKPAPVTVAKPRPQLIVNPKPLTKGELESALTFLMANGEKSYDEGGVKYSVSLEPSRYRQFVVSYHVQIEGNHTIPFIGVDIVDNTKLTPKVKTVFDGIEYKLKSGEVLRKKTFLDGRPDMYVPEKSCAIHRYLDTLNPSIPQEAEEDFYRAIRIVSGLQKGKPIPLTFFTDEIWLDSIYED